MSVIEMAFLIYVLSGSVFWIDVMFRERRRFNKFLEHLFAPILAPALLVIYLMDRDSEEEGGDGR